MSNILHRLTIDAAPKRVQELVATKEGIEQWWTGQPVDGAESVGGQIAVSFGDTTAAVFEIAEQTPHQIAWRCTDGPHDWIDTRITFTFEPRSDGGTTPRFTHEGWQEETDLMSGCSTNWAAYLMAEPKDAASAPSLAARSAAGINPPGWRRPGEGRRPIRSATRRSPTRSGLGPENARLYKTCLTSGLPLRSAATARRTLLPDRHPPNHAPPASP